MNVAQIRQAFLDFFAAKGHTIVPASSLIPHNDPTLLFTNSGMVQFKDVFLGQETKPYKRATSAQKSLRAGGKHNDLENVGYTARHHTFFEMMGNFSFGDYFKKEAIHYAWELLTTVYKLPAEKLWVTVYHTDDEAYDIWVNEIGVPTDRMIRIGDNKGAPYASDNFWQMGDTGPCGPCSEIFYDHGEGIYGGPPGSPDEDGDRYIEIWNLVFMQYNRDTQGQLSPLPTPCVDTGMGLERISAVLQHVYSNYEIDLFQNILQKLAQLTHLNDINHVSLKVMADHLRAMSFLLLEGIVPSNEGRGYVLRRIMRRAIRHGYKLGMREAFIYQAVPVLIEQMGSAYPALHDKKTFIQTHIENEEVRFLNTLTQGMELLETAIEQTLNQNSNVLAGDVAFKLHDTYGFPLDLTADVCRERHLSVDESAFETHMQSQRERARAAGAFKSQNIPLENNPSTIFEGYTNLHQKASLQAVYYANQKAENLYLGESYTLLLDHTPFYAESGGQTGDIGEIAIFDSNHTEKPLVILQVNDTQKQGEAILHIASVAQQNQSDISLNDLSKYIVFAKVDEKHRQSVTKHHSATHLLHHVLREVLGEHIEQKGSLVQANRLRFDFSHPQAIDRQTLQKISQHVNQMILANHLVTTDICDLEVAKARGAMALFGEKYQDQVRVLAMGASIELCGGTHVQATGEIGCFIIESESGVAAGTRRIEALVGEAALAYIQNQQNQLQDLAAYYRVSLNDLPEKLEQQQKSFKELQKSYENLESKTLDMQLEKIAALSAHQVNSKGIVTYVSRFEGAARDIKIAAENLRNQILQKIKSNPNQSQKACVVLICQEQEKAHLAIASNDPAYSAGDLVRALSTIMDGKGGGKPDLAQGGGQAHLIDKAIAYAKDQLA
jgi:alanyl-tRNA synthetase